MTRKFLLLELKLAHKIVSGTLHTLDAICDPLNFNCELLFCQADCAQTSSEGHPASYPMGTGGPFLGGKALHLKPFAGFFILSTTVIPSQNS